MSKEVTDTCDIGWVASSIREVRFFWSDVYQTSPVIGYIMLLATFFLVWYALYVWGGIRKEKAIDKKLSKKRRKND